MAAALATFLMAGIAACSGWLKTVPDLRWNNIVHMRFKFHNEVFLRNVEQIAKNRTVDPHFNRKHCRRGR